MTSKSSGPKETILHQLPEVNDRRHPEPDLQRDGYELHHVPEVGRGGSQEDAEPVSHQPLQNVQHRQPDNGRRDPMPRNDHHDEQDGVHDEERDESADHLVKHKDGMRKGDLLDEVAVT